MKSLFLLTLLSTSAFAVKGEYIQGHDLASTCILTFFVKKGEKVLTGTCSGSFIGNKTFVTAEHCYDEVAHNSEKFQSQQLPQKSFFTCPGSEKKYQVQNLFPMKNSRSSEWQDLALIKVEESVDAPPIQLPKSADEIENALKDKENCYMSGYGLDNEDKYGVLKTARVASLENSPKDLFSVGSTQRVRLRENYTDHGDSGGPLYCKTPNGTILIGAVHGGVKGVKFNDVEKINAALDWINYHKDNANSNEDTFQRVMINSDLCQNLIECSEAMKKLNALSGDVEKVMSKLIKKSDAYKMEVLLGGETLVVKMEEVWEEMIKQWEKNDCYKKLYPDKSN
jgi:V8-like Glu-specific endopeptidase